MPVWLHGQEPCAPDGSTVFSMYLRSGQIPPRPTCGVRRVWRDQRPRHRTAEGTGVWEEISDPGLTRCDRFVPGRSYFKPHRTQCSAILTTFTPRFRAVQHHIRGSLMGSRSPSDLSHGRGRRFDPTIAHPGTPGAHLESKVQAARIAEVFRARSSVGRAPPSHGGGHEFESRRVHPLFPFICR